MKKLKIFLNLLMVSTLILFSGCSTKEVIKYVDRSIEAEVPIKCKAQKEECEELSGNIANKLGQAMECVANLNKTLKACQ